MFHCLIMIIFLQLHREIVPNNPQEQAPEAEEPHARLDALGTGQKESGRGVFAFRGSNMVLPAGQ